MVSADRQATASEYKKCNSSELEFVPAIKKAGYCSAIQGVSQILVLNMFSLAILINSVKLTLTYWRTNQMRGFMSFTVDKL